MSFFSGALNEQKRPCGDLSHKVRGKKAFKEFVFFKFFLWTFLSTVLVYVSVEKMRKGAIYELDSHFIEKNTLDK